MFVARDGLLVEIESPGPTENGKGFCVRIARHGTLERSEVAQPAAQQRSFYCEIRIMNQCDEISLSDEQRDECLTRLNEDGFSVLPVKLPENLLDRIVHFVDTYID